MSLVVITRPIFVAEPIISALQEQSIEHLVCPLIAVQPNPLSIEENAKLESLQTQSNNHFSHIFVSPSAVHFSLKYFKQFFSAQAHNTLYAIGEKTADTLISNGYTDIKISPFPYNSEQLLTLDSLQFGMETQKMQFILWSGLGGRKLIENTLLQRGFCVNRFPVYQQTPQELNDENAKKLKDYRDTSSKPLIITATSQTIVKYLQNNPLLCNYSDYLICLSPRIADYAHQQGWKNVFIANSASNSSLIDEIFRALRL